VQHAHAIGEVQGVANLTALETPYTAYYRDLEREALRSHQVEIVSAFYTRLAVLTLKFAVLLELARSATLSISKDALDEAITLTTYRRASLQHLIRVEFAATPGARTAQRVLQVITAHPGIKRGWILKRTGSDARMLKDALETLTQQEAVYELEGQWWPA
jgi:hypothetical protein